LGSKICKGKGWAQKFVREKVGLKNLQGKRLGSKISSQLFSLLYIAYEDGTQAVMKRQHKQFI
jgi:hypothetical protein